MDEPETMRRITPDQVVAYNLRRARELRGWTQSTAAEKLEPYLGERWSSAVFSAAERSYDGTRIREFTASHVLAFALGFGLPFTWFYEPPEDDVEISVRGSDHAITRDALADLLGVTAAERWEQSRKVVYELARQVAGSGEPDYGLIGRVLSSNLLTTEEMASVVQAFQATAPTRNANYEAMKGAFDGE